MRKRLTIDSTLLVVGAIGLCLALAFYDSAFPSASIDFKASRAEVFQIAEGYLRSHGYDLSGYDHGIVFAQSAWTSYYLERALGLGRTNELIREGTIPMWYWYVRWFKPLQKEEFKAFVTPEGEILGFDHVIPEDAEGADLTSDEALAIATRLLTEEQGLDFGEYELQSSTEDKKENRTDHYFVWKKRGSEIEEGDLRINATVLGGSVGGFNPWFRVPERFFRSFSEERSRADLLATVSYTLGQLLAGGALIVFLIGFKRGTLKWRGPLILGAVIGIIEILNTINQFPIAKIYYDTSEIYLIFLSKRLLSSVGGAAYTALFIALLGVSGERAARWAWGRKNKVLNWRGDPWVSLATSCWRGLLIALMGAGYGASFYLIARRFGAWSPLEAEYSNLYSTPMPFLAPLLAGAGAAIAEECLFRLFSISILAKLTKSRPVALLVPALIWGFAHSGWLTKPIYLRGIEVTLSGLFLGWIFLRFDLVTTVVAHYSINAVVIGLPLIRSKNPYFFLSGVIVMGMMAIPLIPGVYRLLRLRLSKAGLEVSPLILEARLDDIEGIVELQGKRLPPFLPPGSDADGFRARLKDAIESPDSRVLCLKMGERVIGYIMGTIDDGQGRILDILVAEAFRHRYYGSDLCSVLAGWFQRRGLREVKVIVDARDRAAVAFWNAQNLSPLRVIYRARVEDLLLGHSSSWLYLNRQGAIYYRASQEE